MSASNPEKLISTFRVFYWIEKKRCCEVVRAQNEDEAKAKFRRGRNGKRTITRVERD